MAKKIIRPTNEIEVNGENYTIIGVDVSEGRITQKAMCIEFYNQKVKKGDFCRDVLTQRLEGQWSNKKNSELIVAILEGRPIGSILYTGERMYENMYQKHSLLDGLQRTRAITGYVNNEYPLSKSVKPFGCLIKNADGKITNCKIDIAGKKFKQLPPTLQQVILDYNITLYEYSGFTDEELDDIIYGINSGTAFKPNQKLRLAFGTNTMRYMQCICDNPLWDNVDGCNAKNDSILGCITRTMMIMMDSDYKNLSASEMISFAEDFDIEEDKYTIQGIGKLVDRLNDIVNSPEFSDEDMEFFNACNIPHIIAVLDEWTGTDEQFVEFLIHFLHSDRRADYNKYAASKSGSGAKQYSNENVNNRHSVIYNAMIDYIADNNIEGVESDETADPSDSADDMRDSGNSNEYGAEGESEESEQLLLESCEVSECGKSEECSGYSGCGDDIESPDSSSE